MKFAPCDQCSILYWQISVVYIILTNNCVLYFIDLLFITLFDKYVRFHMIYHIDKPSVYVHCPNIYSSEYADADKACDFQVGLVQCWSRQYIQYISISMIYFNVFHVFQCIFQYLQYIVWVCCCRQALQFAMHSPCWRVGAMQRWSKAIYSQPEICSTLQCC